MSQLKICESFAMTGISYTPVRLVAHIILRVSNLGQGPGSDDVPLQYGDGPRLRYLLCPQSARQHHAEHQTRTEP